MQPPIRQKSTRCILFLPPLHLHLPPPREEGCHRQPVTPLPSPHQNNAVPPSQNLQQRHCLLRNSRPRATWASLPCSARTTPAAARWKQGARGRCCCAAEIMADAVRHAAGAGTRWSCMRCAAHADDPPLSSRPAIGSADRLRERLHPRRGVCFLLNRTARTPDQRTNPPLVTSPRCLSSSPIIHSSKCASLKRRIRPHRRHCWKAMSSYRITLRASPHYSPASHRRASTEPLKSKARTLFRERSKAKKDKNRPAI